jgi:lysyl-tRNA synthetase class 2
MEECELLIPAVARSIGLDEEMIFRGHVVNLTQPWEALSVRQAFQRYTRSSMGEALEKGLFDELMVQEIEPKLGLEKPTFLYDYPAQRGALARLKLGDPAVAERFELYIGGLELANGFSELVDPEEQRRRFEKENENRRLMGKAVYSVPEKFLSELGEMPTSAGIALGIDRLVMVFLNAPTIDDVVAFTPEEL